MTGWLRRLVVRSLAKCINQGKAGYARAEVDRAYAHQPEEWRRELWREAAERAANVSQKQ